jgi:DNA polymerase-3 subunit beta
MKCLIKPKILAALAKHIAPKNELRYYLNGVHVEISKAGITYVATNGHMLAAIFDAQTDMYQGDTVSVIIPVEVAKGLKTNKYVDLVEMDLDPTTRQATISGLSNNGTVGFIGIDGIFPDWRRVIPDAIPDVLVASHYNPKYLVSLAACVLDALDTKYIRVFQDGDGAAAVLCSNQSFIGVIMPERSTLSCELPNWHKLPVVEDLQVAA